MSQPRDELYAMEDIKLSKNQSDKVKKESNIELIEPVYFQNRVPNAIKERYKFSNYHLDPNRYRFKKVILAFGHQVKMVKLVN